MSTQDKSRQTGDDKPQPREGRQPPGGNQDIGVNSAPFDDSPQREDETLSGILNESDPQRKSKDKP